MLCKTIFDFIETVVCLFIYLKFEFEKNSCKTVIDLIETVRSKLGQNIGDFLRE